MEPARRTRGHIAIGGGRGFIGGHLARSSAAAGSLVSAFGREGAAIRDEPVDTLVWAAGGRTNELADLEAAHVSSPTAVVRSLRPARVVYLSSGAVYGRGEVPFRETDPARPTSPYGEAKLRGENAVADACAQVGSDCFILRPAVVYGFGQAPGMLLPSALRALLRGERFPCSEGRQTRDFIAVEDVVSAIEGCLCRGATPGTYNVGTGVETTVRDALLMLARACGAPSDRLALGAIPTRPGEATRYYMQVDAAARALGWRATIDLGLGLENWVNRYRGS